MVQLFKRLWGNFVWGLKFNRNRFLMTTSASVMATSFPDLFAVLAERTMRGTQTLKPELANVKACVFDIFGSVVDWRSSVIAEATGWGKVKGLNIDWAGFVDRWRLAYRPTMNQVRKGEIPWTKLD